MRILKPGEPCPCCGTPIRSDMTDMNLWMLSYIAEGLALMDIIVTLSTDEAIEQYEDDICEGLNEDSN